MDKKDKYKDKNTGRSSRTLSSSESKHKGVEDDVSQVISMLQEAVPKVERKKTKEEEKYSQLSNWNVLRPYMSHDFVDVNSVILPPPSISAIPWQSQEHIVLDDVLNILEGFQGKYITAQPSLVQHNLREFHIADSIDPALRNSVQQILPLARDYSVVSRFIEEKRQLKFGRVNQALAAAMDTFISDYTVFIAQLEGLLRKNQLTLSNLWFYLQRPIQTFQVLAKITSLVDKQEALGGQTLTILHGETNHYINDRNAQNLCTLLIKEASVPFFDSVQRWLLKGVVFDPYNEFLIQDNVSLEQDTNTVTGLYSDQYWTQRYTICEENVPVFLCDVKDAILRTGRYLNVIRQCRESTRSSVDFVVPPMAKLVYSQHGEHYRAAIQKPYQFASSKLLDLLRTEYDIINRILSLKRYFLMKQGDFIVHLLDLCEEELVKPISEVIPSRLQSLFELALRTSTGKYDPYKEDITLTILTKNNTYQILSIQSIGSNKQCGFTPEDEELQECSKTGLEGFAFQVVSKWPLSLLFNQKIIGCYQMLFRHLLNCKHVDRRLCQVWIIDKTVKLLPRSAAVGYRGAFSLRQRMLFFVQNLEYYMMEEAIEPNSKKFQERVEKVANVDELLEEHWDFVDQCMKDCMFMHKDLIAHINKTLGVCIEFCDFIQSSDTGSRVIENQSFETNINLLENKFTQSLTCLLNTISNLSQEDNVVDKLRTILYRENFNGFYTPFMEREQRCDNNSSVSASG